MKSKTLNIFSMKRSGQHAIINWLCLQNLPAIHFNACSINKSKGREPRKYIVLYDNNDRKIINKGDISLKDYSLIIYNFENQINKIGLYPEIIIIREPKNWTASMIKSNSNKVPKKHIWKKHANSNAYKILFDGWFENKSYRKKICEDLNLNFSDKGVNDVFWRAESSFDGKTFDGAGQHMDVLHRWKENEKKVSKLVDKEMIKLWKKLKNDYIP